MPIVIIAEKGKPMEGKKKKGFLDYGKDDDAESDDAEEGGDEGEGSASKMRLMHLAEKTGVDDPEALIKLIKACMQQG